VLVSIIDLLIVLKCAFSCYDPQSLVTLPQFYRQSFSSGGMPAGSALFAPIRGHRAL
jgi:hypothetical protein